jgi:aspartate 1-decarboxylase
METGLPAIGIDLRRRSSKVLDMLKVILGSKIHRAIVTDADVNYEGSMAIDEDFLEEAGITPYEKILVGNQTNGNRFETYAIRAPRGSRSIVLNGAVAHLGKTGDRLTIMTFVHLAVDEIKSHTPKVIVLNDDNEVINRRGI